MYKQTEHICYKTHWSTAYQQKEICKEHLYIIKTISSFTLTVMISMK